MAELIDFGSKVHYTSDSPMRWGSEQAISGANKIRDYNRQRAVESALSQNYNPETKEFDRTGIAKSLADKGFGASTEQVLNQIAADRTKLSSDTADAISKDFNLIAMNIMSPKRFIEKWGGTTEAQAYVDKLKSQLPTDATTTTQKSPETSQAPVTTQTTETAPEQPIDLYAKKPEKTPTLPENYFGNLVNPVSRRLFELFGKKSVQAPVETPSGSTVEVTGNEFTSKLPEYKLEDTIPRTDYKIVTKEPTTTTNYLAIDTSEEKLASMFPNVSSDPQDIGSSTFSTEGMTAAEQENLKRYLTREGKWQKGDTLEDSVARFEASKIAAIPRPLLPQPGKNIAEERARYAKELQEYPAKVAEAINTARKELRIGYGEVQELTQAEEEYNSKMSRIKNADIFDKRKGLPTAEGANEVYKIVYEWDDIRQAAGEGEEGFRRAWNAAVSKARLDNNLSNEAIIANLVAMGAVPSRQQAYVKKLLENKIDITGMVADKVFDWFNEKFGDKPKGANPAWIEQQRKNFESKLKMNHAWPLSTIELNLYGKSEPKKESSGNTPSDSRSGAKKAADGYHEDAKAKAKDKAKGKDPLGLGM